MYKKIIILLFSFFVWQLKSLDKADIVIFSFDRPLQLYAFLESLEKYISGLGEINIIYRTRYNFFDKSYDIVKERFKKYNFHRQDSKQPHRDFGPLLFKYTFLTPNEYVLFAVDDIIVKDYVDISSCINALKQTNAYGFYLRLGKNITHCYMNDTQTPVPDNHNVHNDIFIYTFKDGQGDWRYPNCNDMTIYKKDDIKFDFFRIPLRNTSYEGYWNKFADLNKKGLFFEQSKIVNTPLNITNEESPDNKNMKIYSPLKLLKKFQEGYKFNIEQFYKINNNAPHMEIVPEFIKR